MLKKFNYVDHQTAVEMGKQGKSIQEIADAIGHTYHSTKDFLVRNQIRLTDLPWEPDGVKGKKLAKLVADGVSKERMLRAIGCGINTLNARLRQRGFEVKSQARTPAQKFGTWNGGKAARAARIAKADRVIAQASILPPHAMAVERSGPPTGCAHVISDPSDWKRVEYCNAPLAPGGYGFCAAHFPLVPVRHEDHAEAAA